MHCGTTDAPQHILPHTFFEKLSFKKILGPSPGPLVLLPKIFAIPFSRYITYNFFSTFDLILTSFFTVFELLMIIIPAHDS